MGRFVARERENFIVHTSVSPTALSIYNCWNEFQIKWSFSAHCKAWDLFFFKRYEKMAAFVNKRDSRKIGHSAFTCTVYMLNRLVFNYFYLWSWRRQHKHTARIATGWIKVYQFVIKKCCTIIKRVCTMAVERSSKHLVFICLFVYYHFGHVPCHIL